MLSWEGDLEVVFVSGCTIFNYVWVWVLFRIFEYLCIDLAVFGFLQKIYEERFVCLVVMQGFPAIWFSGLHVALEFGDGSEEGCSVCTDLV